MRRKKRESKAMSLLSLANQSTVEQKFGGVSDISCKLHPNDRKLIVSVHFAEN
jgi:hypothetical protein